MWLPVAHCRCLVSLVVWENVLHSNNINLLFFGFFGREFSNNPTIQQSNNSTIYWLTAEDKLRLAWDVINDYWMKCFNSWTLIFAIAIDAIHENELRPQQVLWRQPAGV